MPQPLPFAVARRDPAYAVIEMFGGDNNLADFVTTDLQEAMDGLGHDGALLALVDYASRPSEVLELSGGKARRLAQPGEINTGDGETLAEFLARALVSYDPSVPVAIGFWDHGSGVTDEEDPDEAIVAMVVDGPPPPTPRPRRLRSAGRLFAGAPKNDFEAEAMLHDDTNRGVLTTREAGSVLSAALRRAGRGRVRAIFSDTCLNGMIEVLHEFAPAADCVIGSEALEPGDGWDYTAFLNGLRAPYDGAAWGKAAVAAYEACYRDRTGEHPCTMGAFLSANQVVSAFRALVDAAHAGGAAGFAILDRARAMATSFDQRDCYDLIEFAGHLPAAGATGTLAAAGSALDQAARAARVANTVMGADVARAQGISFWFPSTKEELRRTGATYRHLAFDRETGWTAYLAQHR